jgi:homeobox protein SIX4
MSTSNSSTGSDQLTTPVFNDDQIECICETLYRCRDGRALVRLFGTIDCSYMMNTSASVFRARLYALYHQRQFDQLYVALKARHYNTKYHDELQEMWYAAHYAEVIGCIFHCNK